MVPFEIRRVVTGWTAAGQSVLTGDEMPAPVTLIGKPGSEYFPLWGTDGGTPVVGADPETGSALMPFFPGPNGTRLVVARFAPASNTSPALTRDEIVADAEQKLPGFMGAFESNSRMHTTDTIDYGVCVDGEIWLELDDGAETLINPGTCVVQRGTRHAWHNRSERPCTMVFVLIGAHRAPTTTEEK